MKEADVILALGTRIGFNATFYSYDNINRAAKIIHVEQEPTAIGRYFPVEIGIWGDAPTVARQLLTEAKKSSKRKEALAWSDTLRADRSAFLAQRDADAQIDANPIQPSGLYKTLRDVCPKESAYTMDAGTLCLQATDALNYWQPQSLFTPLDFGLVGFSFAAGLGVKLSMPERPVISLMGDGGFGMTTSELSTAVDYGINTVTVVMNNGCWGAEKAYQRDFFNGRYIGADISSPPFDKLAELYGAKGYRAETLSETAAAIEAALSCGKPAVIDVQVDPAALYSFRRDSFKHRAS
jgi:acetolactate synthase-1/2/3 large subunit/sulfoacetaldehyde acetyltransferase